MKERPPAEGWALYFDTPRRYEPCVRLQERLVEARREESIPDTVLFLEHVPVVTLGRRGRRNYLRASAEELEAAGVDLVHASRGGDVTYHAPGQLVIYPVLKLGTHEADAHGYLNNLEEIAIRTAADFGVEAFRREGMNGAWTAEGKIAAIGFKIRRWITYHGMSFNVDLDLQGFNTIVPCGLEGERVASLKTIKGPACPPVAEVRESMRRNFERVCQRSLDVFGPETEKPEQLAALFPLYSGRVTSRR